VAGHLGGGQDQLGHLLRMVISERWPESISSSPLRGNHHAFPDPESSRPGKSSQMTQSQRRSSSQSEASTRNGVTSRGAFAGGSQALCLR
jgi:hypothetical protein